MTGNIMDINLRADAPDQSDVIDPKKLSEEVEKLKSLQFKIKSLEDQVKDLKAVSYTHLTLPTRTHV